MGSEEFLLTNTLLKEVSHGQPQILLLGRGELYRHHGW